MWRDEYHGRPRDGVVQMQRIKVEAWLVQKRRTPAHTLRSLLPYLFLFSVHRECRRQGGGDQIKVDAGSAEAHHGGDVGVCGGGKRGVVAEVEGGPEEDRLGRAGDEEGGGFFVVVEGVYKLVVVGINISYMSLYIFHSLMESRSVREEGEGGE